MSDEPIRWGPVEADVDPLEVPWRAHTEIRGSEPPSDYDSVRHIVALPDDGVVALTVTHDVAVHIAKVHNARLDAGG